MPQPILRNAQLEKLRQVSNQNLNAATLDITWPIEDGPDGMERRLDALCAEALQPQLTTAPPSSSCRTATSGRNGWRCRCRWPWLLSITTSRARRTRLRTGLVIESGEPRDIHHMAVARLIGYGAGMYLMFESLEEL